MCQLFYYRNNTLQQIRQFSKGFYLAFKSAHLNVPKYEQTNFRIWNTFKLSNVSHIDVDKLKEMAPAPTIPIDQLRVHIASFRLINSDKDNSWIYILLLIICGCLYWRCKNPQHSGARSPSHITYTDPENQNMMHTREDAIRSNKGSDLGLKTVRF